MNAPPPAAGASPGSGPGSTPGPGPAPAPRPAPPYARFLPRSLRARLILLILGAVLVAQAATFAAIEHYRRNYLDTVAPDLMATTIRTLRAAIAQIPEENRADFVSEASHGEWRFESRALPARARRTEAERRADAGPHRPPREGGPPGFAPTGRMPPDFRPFEFRAPPDGRPPPREPPRWAEDDPRSGMRGLIRRLNQQLGEGTRVALSRGPEPALYISLSSTLGQEDGFTQRAWLVISLERISPGVTTPLLVIWLGGLGVILLIAAGFSWHITRPMTSLAVAADQLAAGKPQRVEPSGPHETRVLGERFNAMLDALDASDAVRRTLLAGLPHDLKGPLSRMRLRTEMADDPTLKEGLRKDAQDMQHIVDQFIGYVRGTDPAAYHFDPMDLGDWLSERIHAWKGTGTAVELAAVPSQELRVNGDAVALARMVDNLIQNALQHGAPPVDIRLTQRGANAVIQVRDHGPGISPDRRYEALQPFARLDPARSRTGNVGLGLALVDAIARAHGGRIALEQADSGGLQVDVELPLIA